jgi:hypothetical protein
MKKNALISFAISLLFLSACHNSERKAKLDNAVSIHVSTSQHIIKPDELLAIHNKDVAAFKKNFHDSIILIDGDIDDIDLEHGEVLLRNSFEHNYVVCLVKDSTILSLLRESDKVLFKGICKEVGGNGLVLIDSCQLVQLTPPKDKRN